MSEEYWKDQAESWQNEFLKMVGIRDHLVAELSDLKSKVATLLEGLPVYSKSASMYQRVEAIKKLLGQETIQ